ncbi:MAG: tagaturonate reductase [Daejeonella sp.]
MILNKENLSKLNPGSDPVSQEDMFKLPEKVLQFGTGVLLRGLPDYFIDNANRKGLFNGRVVVIKSTTKGEISGFDRQNGLYTICVRGIADQKKIEQNIVCSAISRVLNAGGHWPEILEFAGSPDLKVVISNTTEAGIQLIKENINDSPPVSFPGKLLAILYKRYQAFAGDRTKGLVILPTELIPDNGKKLKEIVLELAAQNNLEEDFTAWVSKSNNFCNTLVDRIVPGKPAQRLLDELDSELGYKDELIIIAEVYKLWVIEGDERVKNILSFSLADPGVIITPDIDIYRELKLRLLNGTHTLSCGIAFLAGIETVKQAMGDEKMLHFISNIMFEEISAAIPYPVSSDISLEFCQQVLDRFRNPHIEHHWLSISVNYTAKMELRVVPVLIRYYEVYGQVPAGIAFGFACYILFMKPTIEEEGKYYGYKQDKKYLIDDDKASLFFLHWQNKDIKSITVNLLSETKLWNTDLTKLPGFAKAVTFYLRETMEKGVKDAIGKLEMKKLSV